MNHTHDYVDYRQVDDDERGDWVVCHWDGSDRLKAFSFAATEHGAETIAQSVADELNINFAKEGASNPALTLGQKWDYQCGE